MRILFAPLVAVMLGAGVVGAQSASPKFMFVVHGGAGGIRPRDMTPERELAYVRTLDSALRQGHEILRRGGRSLDAVQAAIELLEDSPLFNAGRGSVFTSAGVNELDASIMDGRTLNAGAVAGVTRIKNPIALARLVMERSPHVMLAGEGAEAFARAKGMALVSPKYFYVEERWKQKGTVGAAALDAQGNLAAGTSTGGLANKHPGRVGDSPIIGAGTYANRLCAVSATGHGEYFIRNAVAHDICARVEYKGEPVAQAADAVVMGKLAAQGGVGGVIALDRDGNVAMPFNSEGMFRGSIGPDGRAVVKMYKD